MAPTTLAGVLSWDQDTDMHGGAAICAPRRLVSGEASPAHAWISGFQPPGLGDKNSLLFEPSVLSCFARAAGGKGGCFTGRAGRAVCARPPVRCAHGTCFLFPPWQRHPVSPTGKLRPAEAKPVGQTTQPGRMERARSPELGFSNLPGKC